MKRHLTNLLVLLPLSCSIVYPLSVLSYGASAMGPTHSQASVDCRNSYDQGLYEYAEDWGDEVYSHGWSLVYDPFIQGTEFCDASANASCHDGYVGDFDGGDATLVNTHGGWNDNRFGIKLSTMTANPGSGDCWAMHSWGGIQYWKIGNSDVEFAEASACNSADMNRFSYIRGWSWGLHQWHGNHGFGGISMGSKLNDYADDAFDGSASQAWISNMTQFNYRPAEPVGHRDVCGMSVVMGTSTTDCNVRRANETYVSPQTYSDPPSTSEIAIGHFFCNCGPMDDVGSTPSC